MPSYRIELTESERELLKLAMEALTKCEFVDVDSNEVYNLREKIATAMPED